MLLGAMRFPKKSNQPDAASLIVPTLRKEREEWGTHFLFGAGDLKAGRRAEITV
jgi:hypothetical protein